MGPEIDSGTEGYVYEIEGDPDSVIKIFNPDRRGYKEPKIYSMVDNKPRDKTLENKGIPSIVWPTRVVTTESGGEFLGYQMPYRDLDNTVTAFEYALKDLAWDNSDPPERYKAARNLAIVVHNIHNAGHAIGDFNDQNFLVEDGRITLIDCDSFTVRDGADIYSDITYHGRYSPPQKRSQSLSAVQKADLFCLGVHIFQFLMGGEHPFHAVGDEAATGEWDELIVKNPFPYAHPNGDVAPEPGNEQKYQQLPHEIQTLFEECFVGNSKTKSWSRPSAKEWAKTIGNLDRYDIQQTGGQPDTTGTGGSGGPTTGGSANDPDWVTIGGSASNGSGTASSANTGASVASNNSGTPSSGSSAGDSDDVPDFINL